MRTTCSLVVEYADITELSVRNSIGFKILNRKSIHFCIFLEFYFYGAIFWLKIVF